MSFSKAMRETEESIQASALDEKEKKQAKVFLEIMTEVGNTLLEEREACKEAGEVSHDKVRSIDIQITNQLCDRISQHPDLCDVFCSEDKEPEVFSGENMRDAQKFVLVDAVDNTKGYVNTKRKDFGSSLIGFNNNTGEVFVSIFILPAMEVVLCAFGAAKVWLNGCRLLSLKEMRPPLIRQANVRRPREGTLVSDGVSQYYANSEKCFRNEHFDVSKGPDLTALNSLSIANGCGPTKFLYFAKSWDILSPAYIAFAVGAKATFPATRESVFPLPLWLRTKILAGAEERKKMESQGSFRDLYLIEWPEK
ncbi:MAG: hypothetical protein US74_C0005G0019 [Parcubacteria group bacterium GW2011_GWA2_38_13]|nr:MAG: hypothetical protein US74_C0005G0019 [Parcubacteria group bacterium GW2011_GWA2_38_13]